MPIRRCATAGIAVLLGTIALGAVAALPAQESSAQDPAAVVERHRLAYNAHDIDAVMATYSDSVELLRLGIAIPVLTGRAAMRQTLANVVQAGSHAHFETRHRAVQGPFVIEELELTGTAEDGQPRTEVLIFEVRGGRIRRVWTVPSAARES